MYLYEEKKDRLESDKEKTSSVSRHMNVKHLTDVRYTNVVQRNIIHNGTEFAADKNRIAIDTMSTVPGMDRSHTIPDRVVQNAIVDLLNGKIDWNIFWYFCVKTAGDEAVGDITSYLITLNQLLNVQPQDTHKIIEIANELYKTVANSRFNLRPGDYSGNRSTGNCIDFNGAETVNVLDDGNVIVIQITAVDAAPVIEMLNAHIDALVRVKENGEVVSSTDSRISGHTMTYKITYIEDLDNGYANAYANKI